MSRLVVADDHPFFRLGVDAVLRMGGHEVVAMTGDGDETLSAIEREDPDVVLLDVRMPGRDGIATLADMRMRGDERPVILLTVELSGDQLRAALGSRANGIVFKHDAEDRLLEAIDAVNKGMKFVDAGLLDRAEAQAGPQGSPARLACLTAREREMAGFVARGLRNRDVARRLGTTEGTVKVYLYHIYSKLGLSNRTELANAFNETGDA